MNRWAAQKRYRQRHPEKRREIRRHWYAAHPGHHAMYMWYWRRRHWLPLPRFDEQGEMICLL